MTLKILVNSVDFLVSCKLHESNSNNHAILDFKINSPEKGINEVEFLEFIMVLVYSVNIELEKTYQYQGFEPKSITVGNYVVGGELKLKSAGNQSFKLADK